MRISLIALGVIFLVVGALLYLVPMQELRADTTTSDGEIVDVRTSSASVLVPVGWAYASATIGFVLLILGLIIPGPVLKGIQGPRGPRGRNPIRRKRTAPKRSKNISRARGTSVTTTTRSFN